MSYYIDETTGEYLNRKGDGQQPEPKKNYKLAKYIGLIALGGVIFLTGYKVSGCTKEEPTRIETETDNNDLTPGATQIPTVSVIPTVTATPTVTTAPTATPTVVVIPSPTPYPDDYVVYDNEVEYVDSLGAGIDPNEVFEGPDGVLYVTEDAYKKLKDGAIYNADGTVLYEGRNYVNETTYLKHRAGIITVTEREDGIFVEKVYEKTKCK